MAVLCCLNVTVNLSTNGTTMSDLSTSVFTPLSNNSSANDTEFEPLAALKQSTAMVIVLSVAYTLVFVLGVTGNALVVIVVLRNQRMRTVTNYFIVNLALADILVCLFCLPISLYISLCNGWVLGSAMCKVTPFLQGVSVSASVNTLASIAVDRYLAICHLLQFRLTHRHARLIILGIWTFSLIVYSPWIVFYDIFGWPGNGDNRMYICDQKWPSVASQHGFFLGVVFLTCYTIPLCLITVCYTLIGCRVSTRNATEVASTNRIIQRSKVKALKMLLVVVVIFALSWLPLYSVQIRIFFGPELIHSVESAEFNFLTRVLIPIAQWLGSSNSCVNPIIYCFFSKKFRHGFRHTLRCCHTKGHSSFNGPKRQFYTYSVNEATNLTASSQNTPRLVVRAMNGRQRLFVSEMTEL